MKALIRFHLDFINFHQEIKQAIATDEQTTEMILFLYHNKIRIKQIYFEYLIEFLEFQNRKLK